MHSGGASVASMGAVKSNSYLAITHRIHGTGIFTYMRLMCIEYVGKHAI